MLLDVRVTLKDQLVEITLAGELREDTVPLFQRELEKVAPSHPKRVVLYVHDLTYMASAGLRMLISIKQQKIGAGVDVYIIAPRPQALEVIERASLHNSFIIQQTYVPLE